MSDLFDSLCHHYSQVPDRRGEVYVSCPFCGVESSRGNVHCSFSANGFYCFVCGTGCGLRKLAEYFGAEMEIMETISITTPDARLARMIEGLIGGAPVVQPEESTPPPMTPDGYAGPHGLVAANRADLDTICESCGGHFIRRRKDQRYCYKPDCQKEKQRQYKETWLLKKRGEE